MARSSLFRVCAFGALMRAMIAHQQSREKHQISIADFIVSALMVNRRTLAGLLLSLACVLRLRSAYCTYIALQLTPSIVLGFN